MNKMNKWEQRKFKTEHTFSNTNENSYSNFRAKKETILNDPRTSKELKDAILMFDRKDVHTVWECHKKCVNSHNPVF